MITQAKKPEVSRRVVLDVDRCIECRSCAAACCAGHARMTGVSFARAGWALLPLICRQCKSPSCVDACPVEAMVRDESGVVRRRLFRCIGCGSCARACPFGVISDELGGVPGTIRSPGELSGRQIAKCDLCADRLDDGEAPRCVAACPSGALRFVDEHQAESEGLLIIGGRSAGDTLYKRR